MADRLQKSPLNHRPLMITTMTAEPDDPECESERIGTEIENVDVDAWLSNWYETHQLDEPDSVARYTTCRILEESGIPCVVWHEDALQYYGVKTDLFDIYILVPDVPRATETLVHRGYNLVPQKPIDKRRTSETMEITQRLEIPGVNNRAHFGIDPADVVLSPMKDWDFIIPSTPSPRPSFIPQLPDLNDILIDKWLDNSDFGGDFKMRLAYYLGYLFAYIPVYQSPDFAQVLRLDHRQYHADLLSGMNMFTEPCRKHQRGIRDLIRAGQYELRECSASKENERLFTDAAEARLLAKMSQVEADSDNEGSAVQELVCD